MKFNSKLVYIAIFLILVISYLSYLFILEGHKKDILQSQKIAAHDRFVNFNDTLQKNLTSFENNIISILNNRQFIEYLQAKHKRYYLINEIDEITYKKSYVEELFLSISLNSNDIFQLRYIDPFGKEEVRVDKRRNGTVFLVDNLQDKSDRYYFTDTKKAAQNSFWYSKFDLNIEYGQIEKPLRPTLRVSTPVYTNGIFDGILIVNIDMNNTLNTLFKNTPLRKVLLDEDNHILFSNDTHLDNWSRYLNTPKFKHEEVFELLDERVDIHNDEKLRLKIYYENQDIESLLDSDRINLILYILIIDMVLLLILFILFKNSYLNHAIEKALEKQEDLLNKINSFIIMSKTDVDGNITYVTDEFCRLSEFTKEELIGKKHNIIKDNEVDPKVYEDLWATIINGNQFHTKLPIITKSGERRYWDINIFPQKDDNGNIIEYIAYRRDETAQTLLKEHNKILEQEIDRRTKELQDTVIELNHANETLSNINEELACSDEELRAQQEELIERQNKIIELSDAKEQFLSNMSHEIRTPLNGIVGITDILLNDDNLDKNTTEKLNIIKSSSRILNTVVNDILDYTALKSGKIQIYKNEFNFKEMIKNIENLMKPEIVAKGLNFDVSIDEKIENILIGDEFRINQIIMNLLSNAKKFTQRGFIKLNLNCVYKDEEKIRIRFGVIDSGIGMDDEVKKNIFTAFNQSDKSNTSKHRGTGLGLSICKYLINMMHGKVWFESSLNKGTMIFFSLDLKYTNHKDMTTSNYTDKFVTLKEKKTALLVEDDKVNQIVGKTLLEKIGFNIEIAENGLEAVNKCRVNQYDIIFMDIQMPIMNGYDATIKIKEFNEKTPIVALSAGALPEDIHKSHEVGMDMHISKPIVMRDINLVIEKFFEINEKKIIEVTKEIETKIEKEKSSIIDLLSLMETFNDKETIKELLDLFKDSYADYEECFEKYDDDMTKKYIHKLKGAAGNLKFKEIQSLCKEYENSIDSKDLVIDKIKDTLKKLIEEIENF